MTFLIRIDIRVEPIFLRKSSKKLLHNFQLWRIKSILEECYFMRKVMPMEIVLVTQLFDS